MSEPNSEEKSIQVEEIMAKIRKKIHQEQKTQDHLSESESSKEMADPNKAEQEDIWLQYRKNMEFRFWDQHLQSINNLWKELANADSDEARQDTFWSEHKKNIEFRFWDQHLQAINNLWKELASEEQPESEETKIVKFELWHYFLTALNQKWQLTHIRNTLTPSSRPLIGRLFDFLRLKVYSWLDPVFNAQQAFNSTLVQFVNEFVERFVQVLSRIVRLERKLDKQRAISGEAVKFYNETVRFLAEETTALNQKLSKQRDLSGESVRFYNEVVRFLTEEITRIDQKLDQGVSQLTLESKRIDTLLSMASYGAFMEHRQEMMETQIKELQNKVQELERQLAAISSQ